MKIYWNGISKNIIVLHSVSFQSIIGYSLASLILASCVLNCQLIFACSLFLFTVQARTCCLKLSRSGSSLLSACRLMTPISISAIRHHVYGF